MRIRSIPAQRLCHLQPGLATGIADASEQGRLAEAGDVIDQADKVAVAVVKRVQAPW